MDLKARSAAQNQNRSVIPRLRINYEMRASHERNPLAMITHYEKHFEERSQGKGIPLRNTQPFIDNSASAE